MLTRYKDLACDGCSTAYDGDPISVINTTPIPNTVRDPKKIQELTYFCLCATCKPEYKYGAKSFFIPDYFTEDELYCCIYCDNFIPEDVRDEYDDTEVCLTCSPPIDEDY